MLKVLLILIFAPLYDYSLNPRYETADPEIAQVIIEQALLFPTAKIYIKQRGATQAKAKDGSTCQSSEKDRNDETASRESVIGAKRHNARGKTLKISGSLCR